MSDHVRRAKPTEVPVLDLAPLTQGGDIDALAEALDHACRNTGFFYISNHGVAENVLKNAFDATRRYFELPEGVREKDLIDPYYRRGYMPQGNTRQQGYQTDLKESFEVGVDLPSDDPDVIDRLPLHAPNKWPADLPWMREAAETYFDETAALARRLLRLIARALKLESDFFVKHTRKPMFQMRMFHYPQQLVFGDLQFGAAPHTDYGMITILAQDPIGGLEIRTASGEWIAAPYIEGTFVINIGDLFQRWTNDLYRSTIHRVTNRTGRERYSIPMFINLDYDAPVESLPTCVGPDHPSRYPPIKFGEYVVSRFETVQNFKSDAAAR